MGRKAITLRDKSGLQDAETAALAASKAALGDSALSGYGKKGKKKKHKKHKRGLNDSLSSLKDSLRDSLSDFGQNVAYNVGSTLNPIAARDVGVALLGGAFSVIVPSAIKLTARALKSDFDHNGLGGALAGLGATVGVGLLTRNVPFIAGGFAATATKVMYAYLDEPFENLTGVRYPRLDPKADSSVAGLYDGDGIYDNQPYPKKVMIDGQPGMIYTHDEMMQELEKGRTIRLMYENGESVNGLADDIAPPLLADAAGQHWIAVGDGGYVLSDAEANPLPNADGNFFYRAPDGQMKVVNEEMQEVIPTMPSPVMSSAPKAQQSGASMFGATMQDNAAPQSSRYQPSRGVGRYGNSRASTR